MKALSNKTTAVLNLLREDGEHEWTAKDVAAEIQSRTPCGTCDGSKVASDGDYCRRCYGRGTAHFDYSAAHVALKQLMSRRLVSRRYILDEWGDATNKLVWKATPWLPVQADVDELEAAFQAPAAQR